MAYIIYDTTMDSPSLKERDILWSVLLFGDKIQFTSGASLLIIVYAGFAGFTQDEKVFMYALLGPKLDPQSDWTTIQATQLQMSRLRNKKYKTGEEMKVFQAMNAMAKKLEIAFVNHMETTLAFLNYKEIVSLLKEEETKPADFSVKIGKRGMERLFDGDIEENLITIITDAILQQDNLILFDERIKPFIEEHPIEEFNQHLKSSKAVIFSERILTMPLCFSLKTNEIQMARNELKPKFKPLHDCIHEIAKNKTGIPQGMGQLRSLLPSLQSAVSSNALVSKAGNQQETLETVDLHLGITSNREMLTLLHKRGMLNEDELLQAGDIVQKNADLNSMRPFMYITH